MFNAIVPAELWNIDLLFDRVYFLQMNLKDQSWIKINVIGNR